MKNFPLLFCLVLFLASGVFAQTDQSSNCPTVDVSGGGIVERGELMSFTANVSDSENRPLEYIWTVSSGRIIAGQGTLSITVETDSEENLSLTVTVEVKGLPDGCSNIDSESVSRCIIRRPILFDEFDSITNDGLEPRVQNFYVGLDNHPGAQIYIINYGTNREIARREKQIRDGIAFLKLDASRVTLVDGGLNPRGKGVWTRVWLVPPGVDTPTPNI